VCHSERYQGLRGAKAFVMGDVLDYVDLKPPEHDAWPVLRFVVDPPSYCDDAFRDCWPVFAKLLGRCLRPTGSARAIS
jgi:hypothetical protein